MQINEAYPSEYLRASDAERALVLVMSHVDIREVGDEHKPVLFFIGQQKGLVLNKTNATRIADAYGNDTDQWQGKRVQLYVDKDVMYAGRKTPAIRVRTPSQPFKASEAAAPPPPEPAPVDDFNQDIPF